MLTKKNTHGRKCNQCGSDLILVKEIIEEKDLPSPVITTIYRCSSKECQEEIDKKAIAGAKHYREQEQARKKRYKNRSK